MDTQSSEGVRLLSLDGGGVRELASLLILQRIMYNLDSKVGPEVERPLLPCNYFDMIAGTSTGGLIAIMLGVLRMDIDTCISKYLSMAPKIFPEEGFVSGSKFGKLFKGVRGKARFDAMNLENTVREMISEAFGGLGENSLLQSEQSEETLSQCRTFVCVTNKDVGKPFRLRNYRSAWEPSTGCTIWEAARATSAAPLYFPPIIFGKPPTNYVDGGLNYNNPVRSLYDEAKHVWGKSHREIKCIISIGTGVPPLRPTGDTGKEMLESVVNIATDTQRTADEFAEEMEHLPEDAKVDYYRLNVDRGLENMSLEEWGDFDMLTGATSYYLNSHKADLDRCSSALLDTVASGDRQDTCSVILSELPISSHTFFGRALELSQLHTLLALQSNENRRQRAVLWGLGGLGKTRITLEYLKKYREEYSAVLWINAATYESAEISFAQAATLLRSRHALQADLPSAGARADMRLVQHWLASCKNKHWLMVLDSLDDLDSVDCRDLLPQCSHGNIIVTSTLSHTVDVLGFQGLEISGLDLDHGCEMLLSGMSVQASLDKEIPKRIVKAMNGVPLAIEQARAMIKQGIQLRDFLGYFETQYQRLMAQKPPKSAWDYEKNMSIVSIFNMLLTRLDKDGDAEKILAFASCFGPRPIAVKLMSQVHQLGGSTVPSRSGQSDEQHTSETTSLHHFELDPLAFQLATGQLERLCFLKLQRDSEGNTVSVSLHDSISRWRFETLARDMKEKWIITAAYALSKCLPKNVVDQHTQMRFLPLTRHFYNIIRRYIEPQKLEMPDGELYHQYGHLMGQFAHLYLNSGHTVEGENVFLQAIDYQRIFREPSWLKDRRSLLLLKGLAMMFSKNEKMEAAGETTKTLHDASMSLFGPGDEITSWAAARLPIVMDRKTQNAENELRAVIASQGEKQSSITPRRIYNDNSQSMSQGQLFDPAPDEDFHTRGYNAITFAAEVGDVESIRLELDRGVDVNAYDRAFVSALYLASQNGHSLAVQVLLNHGADVNTRNDRWDFTALQAACCQGHTVVVDVLLRNGAYVNASSLPHGTGLQIAALEGHYSIVQLLLANGADVNAAGGSYGTALYLAGFNGHHKIAQRLLDSGADVKASGVGYDTALQIPTRNGDHNMVSLLLANGADANVRIPMLKE